MQDRHTDTGQQPGRAQHGATHPISPGFSSPIASPKEQRAQTELCAAAQELGQAGPTVLNREIKPHMDFFLPPPPSGQHP